MSNIDRIKNLLLEHAKLMEENQNSALEDKRESQGQKETKSAKMKEIYDAKFVCDWESLVQQLAEVWGIDSKDMILNAVLDIGDDFSRIFIPFDGVDSKTSLSKFLPALSLFIIDPNDAKNHHFGIGLMARNDNGGKFKVDSSNLDKSLVISDAFAVEKVSYFDIEGKGVGPAIYIDDAPILNDVLVESSLSLMFINHPSVFSGSLDSIDDHNADQRIQNWRIFAGACDRYDEKVKPQSGVENSVPTMQ